MKIEDLSKSFNDVNELQQYAIAQHKSLTELQKKLSAVEEENAHLKILLESQVPLLSPEDGHKLILSDEETIARLQLKKFKESALARELSLDEARRVEIYTKIIHGFPTTKEDKKLKEVRQADDAKLLTMLENE